MIVCCLGYLADNRFYILYLAVLRGPELVVTMMAAERRNCR
jgi:hypothetical protein